MITLIRLVEDDNDEWARESAEAVQISGYSEAEDNRSRFSESEGAQTLKE